MSEVQCCKCLRVVEDLAVEAGTCIGCRKEWGQLKAYSQQRIIDGYQVKARNEAVERGEARRFMGRFSSRLSRYR